MRYRYRVWKVLLLYQSKSGPPWGAFNSHSHENPPERFESVRNVRNRHNQSHAKTGDQFGLVQYPREKRQSGSWPIVGFCTRKGGSQTRKGSIGRFQSDSASYEQSLRKVRKSILFQQPLTVHSWT